MKRRGSRARLRIVVTGIALLFINAAVFAFFTWPGLTRVRRAEARARAVADSKQNLERMWAQMLSRRELLEQNRNDIEALSRNHLKSRAADLFAAQREIEDLAQEAGLRPHRSSYSLGRIRGTNLVRCEVTLPLDGSYTNLTDFLSRIGSARRFIVVDQMALSEDEQGARMSLKLSAIFKEEAAP